MYKIIPLWPTFAILHELACSIEFLFQNNALVIPYGLLTLLSPYIDIVRLYRTYTGHCKSSPDTRGYKQLSEYPSVRQYRYYRVKHAENDNELW